LTNTRSPQLRLRVFAGPNGSGKSTVIERVKATKSKKRLIDFGVYINADDIAVSLLGVGFSFSSYGVSVTGAEFKTIALASGLIGGEFPADRFSRCYFIRNNTLKLKVPTDNERMAQIVADFLRKKLLAERKKFSFETVFSHPSKLEIMRQAAAAGYKVYLYFVSTESPLINEFRVKARVAKGGHHVPVDKIESRYYRSLDLLFEASQIAYQAYYFDNSKEGEDFTMFAHFKVVKNKKKWDRIDPDTVPSWFKKYYSQKIHR
jgi:predicted ABC-type ATPase